MNEEEMKEFNRLRQQLHDSLTKAIDQTLRHDPLYLDDQMGVLADTVLASVFKAAERNCLDGHKYRLQLVNYMRDRCYERPYKMFEFDPDAPMQSEKNEGKPKHKGGRTVIPDAANSWLRVFPSPLSADQMLRAVLIHTDDDRLGYNPEHVANKMQGVLLTSLPDADKADIKRRMKDLRLLIVSKPDHHRLQYVVFGAGIQASTKTAVIADRLAHQEIIEGIYFEDFLQVLDELEKMKDGYDADFYAQMAECDEQDEQEQDEEPVKEFVGQINGDEVLRTSDRKEAYEWFYKVFDSLDDHKDIHNVYLFGDDRIIKQWYDDLPF